MPGLAQPNPDVGVGRRIFESQCALCHGQTGGGGRGPASTGPSSVRRPTTRRSAASRRTGRATCRVRGSITTDEVAGVAAYVRSPRTLPAEKVPGNATRGALV